MSAAGWLTDVYELKVTLLWDGGDFDDMTLIKKKTYVLSRSAASAINLVVSQMDPDGVCKVMSLKCKRLTSLSGIAGHEEELAQSGKYLIDPGEKLRFTASGEE